MAVKDNWVYDATEVNTSVGGERMYGFAEGDMVSGDRANDFVSLTVDAQGQYVFSKNNDKHGTITINLSDQSPAAVILMGYANAQKQVPIDIKTPHEHVWSTGAICQKIPSFKKGTGAGTLSFEFLCGDYSYTMNS